MDERIRAALTSAGFEQYGKTDDATWVLNGGTSRYVSFNTTREGSADVFTIGVEEWRGGEGYEADELRTTSVDELIAAIGVWAAWAREPWVKEQSTWWGRLLGYFGFGPVR